MKTFGHDTALVVVSRAFEQQLLEQGLDKRPWGRALQRSDVTKHIAWSVVHHSWDLAGVERPGPRSLVTIESATRLSDLVAEQWVMIDALCRAGMAVSQWVINRLQPAGLRVTPGKLSEPICTRLKGHYQGADADADTAGTAPDEHDIVEIALEVCDFVVKRVYQPLDRAGFAHRFGTRFDQEWEATGQANMEAHRPSAASLGDDLKPPLVPVDPRQPGTYLIGLGRSVYRRYWLYFRPDDDQPDDQKDDLNDSFDEPDDPRRERDLTDHDALAELEIRRTCSPYGLAEPGHHAVVRAIAMGLSVEDRNPTGAAVERARTTWRAWKDQPSRPIEAADEASLTGAVEAHAKIWQLGGANQELGFVFGPLADQLADVTMAVNRKVWMKLHRQERDHHRPITRGRLSGAMNTALDQAIRDVAQKRRSGELRTQNTPAPDPYDTTLRLLTTVPDQVRNWIVRRAGGDTRWVAEYYDLLAASGHALADCLSDEEMHNLLDQLDQDGADRSHTADGTEDGDD